MGKYYNKKVEYNGEKFDSKVEVDIYKTLKVLEKAKKIKNLKRVTSGVLLLRMGTYLKNKKKTKQRDLTYKCDFEFDVTDKIKLLKNEIENKKVYLEVKSEFLEKQTSYRLRRRLFLNRLTSNEVFIEIIYSRGNYKEVMWETL